MSNVVNIIVTIDTQSIIRDYPSPSQDQNNPTGLNHTYQYMVATSAVAINGSDGTADLNVSANVGDVIRWTGESESANFESSILIYALGQFGGTQVFSNPVFKMFTKASMQPAQNTIFPVTFPNQNFWFIEADITNTGTENYTVKFALYNRPTGGAQQLYGYFYWDPTLTINN